MSKVIAKVFIGVAVLFVFAAIAAADTSITRTGGWDCLDHLDPPASTAHNELHKAYESCVNKAETHPGEEFVVDPPQYRVTYTAPAPPPPPPPSPQCDDGVDNDGDGETDYPADDGCTDAADDDETDPPPPPPPPTGEAELIALDRPSGPAGPLWIYCYECPTPAEVFLDGVPVTVIADTEQEREAFTHPVDPAYGRRIDRIGIDVTTGGVVTVTGASNSLTFTDTGGTITQLTPADLPNGLEVGDYPADTLLLLRGGTYSGRTGGRRNPIIDWDATRQLMCYPGEQCILDATGGDAAIDMQPNKYGGGIVSGVECHSDRNTMCFQFNRGGGNPYFRVVGGRVYQGGGSGAFGSFGNMEGGFDLLFWKLIDSGNGGAFGHGVYMTGNGLNQDVNIMYGECRDFTNRMCVEVYGHNAGEIMRRLFIGYNYLPKNFTGTGSHYGIQVGDSDSISGPCQPGEEWIEDATVHANYVENNTDWAYRFRDNNGVFTITDNASVNNSGDFDIVCAGEVHASGNSPPVN